MRNRVACLGEFRDVRADAEIAARSPQYDDPDSRGLSEFIELSCDVYDFKEIEENLLVFLRLQGDDGNIIDGFIPKSKAVQTEGGSTEVVYVDFFPIDQQTYRVECNVSHSIHN